MPGGLWVRFLSGPDVNSLGLTGAEIIEAVEGAIRAHGEGRAIIEPRVHLVPGDGGHFNVLSCYTWRLRPLLQTIQVEDPWYGTSVWDYDTFRTAYQGSGSWTHSYKTQA